MRRATELSHHDLSTIIQFVIDQLYLDQRTSDYLLDKELASCADFVAVVGQTLAQHGLAPDPTDQRHRT